MLYFERKKVFFFENFLCWNFFFFHWEIKVFLSLCCCRMNHKLLGQDNMPVLIAQKSWQNVATWKDIFQHILEKKPSIAHNAVMVPTEKINFKFISRGVIWVGPMGEGLHLQIFQKLSNLCEKKICF